MVACCLYCLKTSEPKLKCIGATRLVSSQNALYSPLERESLRDETKVRLRKRLRVQPLL